MFVIYLRSAACGFYDTTGLFAVRTALIDMAQQTAVCVVPPHAAGTVTVSLSLEGVFANQTNVLPFDYFRALYRTTDPSLTD